MAITYRYGVIDESGLSLHSPRVVDEDFATLAEAMEAAGERIFDGVYESCAVVLCYYSKRHECCVESKKGGCIVINGSDWSGTDVIEESEESV